MLEREDKGARRFAWKRLALWSAVALVVFRSIDTGLYRALYRQWPSLALLPDLRLTSLSALSVAYAVT